MMRFKMGRPILLTTLTLVLLAGPYGASAGKPTPPLPPVRYQIQFFDMPDPAGAGALYGSNNVGQCVGYFEDSNGVKRAFLYDPAVDTGSSRRAGIGGHSRGPCLNKAHVNPSAEKCEKGGEFVSEATSDREEAQK